MEHIPYFPFDEAKAAQIAAHVISKNGGVFDHYDLAKFFYDLDREALNKWGQPVVGGTYRLFAFGPIIYEQYRASAHGVQNFYSAFIQRSGNQLSVIRDPGDDDLSKAEIALAEEVASRWGNLTFKQANDKIHSLPECGQGEKLNGDQIPIELILAKCGKSEEEVHAIAQDVKAAFSLKSTLENPSVGS